MDCLSYPYFFSEKNFPFEEFWKKEERVWEIFSRLEEFFCKKGRRKQSLSLDPSIFLENEEEIFIGEGTKIEKGVFLRGPCIIGKNCEIRHGSYLRGFVWIGDHCVVGHGTEIKNSLLFDRACAAHFSYIGDSLLGFGVNLGAGVKCANFRLDQGEISVKMDGKRISTGRRKLGAIIGDRSQIGCNVVLSPGTLVGKEVLSYPNLHLSGFIPSKTFCR